MAAPVVAVLDYGSGNVHSAVKALERAGAEVRLTADRALIHRADGLLVPGVGAFSAVMAALETVRGSEIVDRRLAGGRPVLGICVGMQILFDVGRERGVDSKGLGQWPGVVEQLPADVLPHMGWDTVRSDAGSVLFDGIADERFYFVHSYAAQQWTLPRDDRRRPPALTWSEHGAPFLAAVENGPLSATQFHPEKSGAAGIRLLRNWLGSL
ncbi:MAG: imidazole glycerol phosphate synthase subunit HisH [Micrococcales bacterium]|nr:imidazole glycerol phosphate synthase subunit HisH [Micrococcales bacterium]